VGGGGRTQRRGRQRDAVAGVLSRRRATVAGVGGGGELGGAEVGAALAITGGKSSAGGGETVWRDGGVTPRSAGGLEGTGCQRRTAVR
jgi:hypothetical protein